MGTTRLHWKKIYAAEIEEIENVKCFAFIKNNRTLHVEQANDTPLFTQLLITAVKHCLSVYSTEIWVGVDATSIRESKTTQPGELPLEYFMNAATSKLICA